MLANMTFTVVRIIINCICYNESGGSKISRLKESLLDYLMKVDNLKKKNIELQIQKLYQ